jgi:hypothetical protein
VIKLPTTFGRPGALGTVIGLDGDDPVRLPDDHGNSGSDGSENSYIHPFSFGRFEALHRPMQPLHRQPEIDQQTDQDERRDALKQIEKSGLKHEKVGAPGGYLPGKCLAVL